MSFDAANEEKTAKVSLPSSSLAAAFFVGACIIGQLLSVHLCLGTAGDHRRS
jgi:hypothetical protein